MTPCASSLAVGLALLVVRLRQGAASCPSTFALALTLLLQPLFALTDAVATRSRMCFDDENCGLLQWIVFSILLAAAVVTELCIHLLWLKVTVYAPVAAWWTQSSGSTTASGTSLRSTVQGWIDRSMLVIRFCGELSYLLRRHPTAAKTIFLSCLSKLRTRILGSPKTTCDESPTSTSEASDSTTPTSPWTPLPCPDGI